MGPARKITIEVPADLLEKAQQATGAGITQTIRTGLQLVAASQRMRGFANYGARFVFRSRTKSSKTTGDRG